MSALDPLLTLVCAALFWTCFCRMTRTSEDTKLVVRLALWAVSLVALAGVMAPWAWGYRAGLLEVSLLTLVLVAQLATAHLWANGVPARCQRGVCEVG